MRLNLHHAEVNTKFPKRIALKTPIFSTLHNCSAMQYIVKRLFTVYVMECNASSI